MAINVSPTPNPNAMKLSVGAQVGGAGTYSRVEEAEAPYVASLLALEGVTQVFLTADFVTLSKAPAASWDKIVPPAKAILEDEFGS